MATMTIGNYVGSADTFTFPHNPQVFDDEIVTNPTFTNLNYQSRHITISAGGVLPKVLVLTGHFDGSSKLTNYRDLAKHVIQSNLLKKLYWETNKFYLCVGRQIKQTNSGGRTNYIDYVCSFTAILGILLDNTQQTHTNGGAHATNSGNVTTFIEEISGVVTSGASPVVVSDGLGNELTIPASALTTGQAVVITFVKMVDSGSGISVTEYNYTTIAGTQTRQIQVTDGLGVLQLAAAATTATLTVSNMNAGWTAKFRNGWSA